MSATMVTPSGTGAPPPQPPAKNYLNASHGIASWMLTVDHKRIAVMYLVAVAVLPHRRRRLRLARCGSN
ncbi:MAG: hypothetical protein U0Q16_36895 [Bryobacteraceae bacterium]